MLYYPDICPMEGTKREEIHSLQVGLLVPFRNGHLQKQISNITAWPKGMGL
jgi:hypothetical protein